MPSFGLTSFFHLRYVGHTSSHCWLDVLARTTTASSCIAFAQLFSWCLVKQVGPECALISSLNVSGNKLQGFSL